LAMCVVAAITSDVIAATTHIAKATEK